ncbi:MAG: ABC transporter permease, partial [Pirellulaceae bacterium]|nr:ABC transporter permease [Pirellulaceae bacterium]
MLVGPVFTREAAVAPRRRKLYVFRTVYAISLLLLMCTAWLILVRTQVIRNLGDMARFGAILFQILAPLQLVLILFMAAVQTASSVAIEKDKQTLILLLMTRLSNSELVLGKLFASLLGIGVMLLTAVPIFMLIVLFGGTSFDQVGWTFAVTVVTAFASGSLGSTIALWREKTFQTLALVALSILFWVGGAEAIAAWGGTIGGISAIQIATALNPLRAILIASSPSVVSEWSSGVMPFLCAMGGVAILLNILAISCVRRWNPSRDVRIGQSAQGEDDTVFSETAAMSKSGDVPTIAQRDETSRQTHVDARVRTANQKSRKVWDNPVLWRECCTWAYGKRIIFIRGAYWVFAAAVFYVLFNMVQSGNIMRRGSESAVAIPAAAWAL